VNMSNNNKIRELAFRKGEKLKGKKGHHASQLLLFFSITFRQHAQSQQPQPPPFSSLTSSRKQTPAETLQHDTREI
jgi:hypothetical protein